MNFTGGTVLDAGHQSAGGDRPEIPRAKEPGGEDVNYN